MPIMIAQKGLSQPIGRVSGSCVIRPSTRVRDLITVCLHLLPGRPVVMPFIQIIPGHFVNTDGKHRLEVRVDPLVYDPGDIQLVDKEGGGMAEVEDQRVAQPVGAQVKSVVISEGFVQLFVNVKSVVEILQDLGSLLLGITFV